MKKKLLFTWVVLSVLFSGKVAAQFPTQSTEANPVWYYIKVIGSGNTADRVLTATGDRVKGLPVSYDFDTMSRQMWRFEIGEMEDARGYVVTNKATKQKLSVAWDEPTGQRMAVVRDDPSTVWRFLASGSEGKNIVYNIWMSIEPSEGVAGNINLYQTTATYDYTLSFTASSNRANNNARFAFERNENPIASTDTQITWMYLQNTKTKNYLTDESIEEEARFSLVADLNESFLSSQQWKLVYNDDDRINFINRATGNIISTKTHFDRYYYLFNTADPAESGGWNLEPLGSNQFAISTTTPEGLVNYWYATTQDEPTTPYTPGYVLNTPYAWMFTVAEEQDLTGINEPSVRENDIRAYSYNKRIYVDGEPDFRIISVYGTPILRNENLPTGIYLVTVKGKTTKVLVK